MSVESSKGKVYLVGAGPGDPQLITIKGMRCIAAADVVIYDYLAARSLLEHARPQCECIYVGKKGGDHTLPQTDINQLIVSQARAGKIVTRLKGGDPFIFGRGGEEAEVLAAAKVPFEIVPGVTSAIAAPAYAGIPLTHRDFTSTVAFVTGHEDPTKAQSDIDWPALAKGIGTLVFLMGVGNLAKIVNRLRDHGRAVQTPVALVQWGTTNRQRTVVGTLGDIAAKASEAGVGSPAIIIVGEVVSLRPVLQWFETRPLLGRQIMVTRARAQASELVQQLTDLGAQCREYPAIETAPPDDARPLNDAIDRIETYDWIIFTSANAVSSFFTELFAKGLDVRRLGRLRTAAIGPATAAAMRRYGLSSDVIPASYQAESLVQAFSGQTVAGRRMLLPRAQQARDVLPRELRRLGAHIDEVPAYQTRQAKAGEPEIAADLQKGAIDMITFTSSSTVTNFLQLLPSAGAINLANSAAIACIGPITADTARQAGLRIDVVADTFTIAGLCRAIVEFYNRG